MWGSPYSCGRSPNDAFQSGGEARLGAIPRGGRVDVLLTHGPLPVQYRKLTSDYVQTVELGGQQILKVEPEALRLLAATAMVDIAHLLRPGHLQQLANILDDPEVTLWTAVEAKPKQSQSGA